MRFVPLILLFFGVSGVLGAQTVEGCGKPTSSGIVIGVTTSGDSVARPRSLSMQGVVDTTWVFNVAHKTWPIGRIEAAIKADLLPVSGARVCGGAFVSMDQAVLTIKGASGTVRFRASLGDLSR